MRGRGTSELDDGFVLVIEDAPLHTHHRLMPRMGVHGVYSIASQNPSSNYNLYNIYIILYLLRCASL